MKTDKKLFGLSLSMVKLYSFTLYLTLSSVSFNPQHSSNSLGCTAGFNQVVMPKISDLDNDLYGTRCPLCRNSFPLLPESVYARKYNWVRGWEATPRRQQDHRASRDKHDLAPLGRRKKGGDWTDARWSMLHHRRRGLPPVELPKRHNTRLLVRKLIICAMT
jgi:hypothetical protein